MVKGVLNGIKKTCAATLGHIRKFSLPSQRASLLESIKKNLIFHFIEFDVFGTTINCFSVKADLFVLYFDKNTFLSNFANCFYDRNTFLMIFRKYTITLREEIFAGRKFREFREFWPNSRK